MIPVSGSISVEPLHSAGDIRAEAAAMLRLPSAGLLVTPGRLMQLWVEESPFLTGDSAALTPDALSAARRILGAPDATADEIASALDTAVRPFSIIENSPSAKPRGSYSGFCPEWLADLYAAAGACGAVTWDDFLWKMPMAAAAHLLAAVHRSNGGATARPMNWKSVCPVNHDNNKIQSGSSQKKSSDLDQQ